MSDSNTISIPGYNSNNRVPGVFCVVDPSKANTATANQVSLLIGQTTLAGTATPGEPVVSAGTGDAQASFGPGSQMALSVERYRALDPTGTLYCLPNLDSAFELAVATTQTGTSATLVVTAPNASIAPFLAELEIAGTGITADTTISEAAANQSAGTITLTLSAATTAALTQGAVVTVGNGAAATAEIAFSGTAAAAGTIPLSIDNAPIPVAVNSSDTATTIAANTAIAINRYTTAAGNPLSCTASASTGTVTLTQRNAGTLGNQSVILLSPLGTAGGQGQPGTTNVAGVTAVITGFSGGEVDPVIANALANLPARPFDFIGCPYNDTASLNAIQSFLGDAAGRWNWSVELFGGAFTAKNGSLGTRTTWSTERNDQHCAAIGAYNPPNPDWHWAVDFCAASAVSIRANPSIPIGGLAGGVALNVGAPPLADQDDFEEQGTLLFDGMSTYVANDAGQVSVQRAITTYQANAAGQPDNAYLSLNVPYQLMAFMRAFITLMSSQFNQVILVADGSRIPAGSNMVTSQTVLYSVIAMYQAMATTGIPGIPVGLVQNPQTFQKYAKAENAGGGIVRMMLPLMLSNQLIAIAADVQFTTP